MITVVWKTWAENRAVGGTQQTYPLQATCKKIQEGAHASSHSTHEETASLYYRKLLHRDKVKEMFHTRLLGCSINL